MSQVRDSTNGEYIMRTEWLEKRKNDKTPTQMYYAKEGIISNRYA